MKTNRTGWMVGMLIWLATIQPGWSFYNPSTGRWLSRDPIGEQGGMNLVGIVKNEPIAKFDRFGLIPPEWDEPIFEPNLPSPVKTSGTPISARLLCIYAGLCSPNEPISPDDMLDVTNGEEVESFLRSLLAEARSKWQCGESGRILLGASEPEYNPASPNLSAARNLDWGDTGTWQLFMSGKCTWKCTDESDFCDCDCVTTCSIKGTISKLYTFVWHPGGNPKNIGTHLNPLMFPVNWLGESYIIDEPFERTGGDIGKLKY